jgi:hypothetical protein
MNENEKSRWNWLFDKVLLAVLGVLMYQSYHSVLSAVQLAQDLDKKMQLVEWRLQKIEYKIEQNL